MRNDFAIRHAEVAAVFERHETEHRDAPAHEKAGGYLHEVLLLPATVLADGGITTKKTFSVSR